MKLGGALSAVMKLGHISYAKGYVANAITKNMATCPVMNMSDREIVVVEVGYGEELNKQCSPQGEGEELLWAWINEDNVIEDIIKGENISQGKYQVEITGELTREPATRHYPGHYGWELYEYKIEEVKYSVISG